MTLNFPPLELTTEGIALCAKNLAGQKIVFTFLEWLYNGVQVAALYATVPPVVEIGQRVRLSYVLTPQGGDYVRFDEARLHADDPDVGDIVYSMANSPVPLDVLNLSARDVPVRAGVGNAENVTVEALNASEIADYIQSTVFDQIEALAETLGLPEGMTLGDMLAWIISNTGGGGGGNKYALTFAETDWPPAVGGIHTIDIPSAQHLCGHDLVAHLWVYNEATGQYIYAHDFPNDRMWLSVDSVGNAKISSAVTFAGKLVISGSGDGTVWGEHTSNENVHVTALKKAEWDAKAAALTGTATIPFSGWQPNANGTSQYHWVTVSAPGVLASDTPVIGVAKGFTDTAADELIQEAWNKVNGIDAQEDALLVMATEIPAVAIPIQWQVVR